MDLFLDIGNTRTKVASYDNNDLSTLMSFSNSIWSDSTKEVLKGLPIKIDNVYIASVADKGIDALVTSYFKNHYRKIPAFLQVEKQCCALETRYDPFTQLGVDRWLSIVGASHLGYSDYTVIDLGTAITVDTVVDKVHLGGLIAPGLQMLQTALIKETAIALPTPIEPIESVCGKEGEFLATNTANAILGGTTVMAVSYLNQMMMEILSQYDASHHFILTGGDATMVSPMLNFECDLEQNLVFHGMRAVLENL